MTPSEYKAIFRECDNFLEDLQERIETSNVYCKKYDEFKRHPHLVKLEVYNQYKLLATIRCALFFDDLIDIESILALLTREKDNLIKRLQFLKSNELEEMKKRLEKRFEVLKAVSHVVGANEKAPEHYLNCLFGADWKIQFDELFLAKFRLYQSAPTSKNRQTMREAIQILTQKNLIPSTVYSDDITEVSLAGIEAEQKRRNDEAIELHEIMKRIYSYIEKFKNIKDEI